MEVHISIEEVSANDLSWMKNPGKARNDGIFAHGHA
jgi:hypothetical protein